MMEAEHDTGSLESGLKGHFTLPLRSVLNQAWSNVDGTKGVFVTAQLITLCFTMLVLLIAILGMISLGAVIPGVDRLAQMIASFIGGAWSICSFAYLIRISLKKLGGHTVSAKGYFKHFHYYAQALALYLLQFIVIMVLAGIAFILLMVVMYLSAGTVDHHLSAMSLEQKSMLLICALFIVAIAFFIYSFFATVFMLAIPVAMDRRIKVWLALRLVFTSLRKKWLSVIKINFALTLILILSMIPFGIALIWTMPLYFNTLAVIYDRALGLSCRA